MPEFELPGAALIAEPSAPAQAVEIVCASPTTAKFLFAALVILVFLACHAVHGEQGPRR